MRPGSPPRIGPRLRLRARRRRDRRRLGVRIVQHRADRGAASLAQHRRRARRRDRRGRALQAGARRQRLDRRDLGRAARARDRGRAARLPVRRPSATRPTACRRACPGRSISATACRAIRSSSTRAWRCSPSSLSISLALAPPRRLDARPRFLSVHPVLRRAALRLGVPEALSAPASGRSTSFSFSRSR